MRARPTRLEVVDTVVSALEEAFGSQWNVAVTRLNVGDDIRFSVYAALEPHGAEMPPIERTYRDKCHRAGLEEDWIYNWVKLDGMWWQVMGWHSQTTEVDNPIVLKTVPGHGLAGQSYIHLKVHQLRKLGWEGKLYQEKPTHEEE